MNTTTPDLIRRDFELRIEEIDPTYSEHQDQRWSSVEEGTVAGSMRTFRIDTDGAKPVEQNRLHSVGEQYRFTMRIVAGYEGLRPRDVQIITQDGVDLRTALERRVGVLTGLLRPRFVDHEVTSFAEDGRVIECAYLYEVDYMHDTGLGN